MVSICVVMTTFYRTVYLSCLCICFMMKIFYVKAFNLGNENSIQLDPAAITINQRKPICHVHAASVNTFDLIGMSTDNLTVSASTRVHLSQLTNCIALSGWALSANQNLLIFDLNSLTNMFPNRLVVHDPVLIFQVASLRHCDRVS